MPKKTKVLSIEEKADKKAQKEFYKLKKEEENKQKKGLLIEDSIVENNDVSFYSADIPLNQISVEGQSVRDKIDDDHVIELASSIGANGLLQPIVVNYIDDTHYQLIGGFHRLTACHRLKLKSIRCNVRKGKINSLTALACVENILRLSMTLKEECAAVERLTTIEKKSPSQICALTGKSRAWVDRRLMCPNLPDNIKQALFENTIPLNIAEILGGCKDEGQRNYILNATIMQGLPSTVVSAMVQSANDNPSIAFAVEAGQKVAQETQTARIPQAACAACGRVVSIDKLHPVQICNGGCDPLPKESEEH